MTNNRVTASSYGGMACYIAFLLVAGVIIQSITVVFILKQENRRKGLTPYLLSIVISNTLLIFTFPTTVISATRRAWLFGERVCRVVGFLGGVGSVSMLVTMACITIKVHQITVQRSTATKVIKRKPDRRYIQHLIVIWVYSFLSMLHPLVGWTKTALEAANTSCAPNWTPETTTDLVYILTLSCLAYVLPVGVSLIYVFRIHRTLTKHAMTIANICSHGRHRDLRNISKIVMLAITAYSLTWLPYGVYVLIAAFGMSSAFTPEVTIIPAYIAKTSVLYNPCIYAILNRRFRSSLLHLIRSSGQFLVSKLSTSSNRKRNSSNGSNISRTGNNARGNPTEKQLPKLVPNNNLDDSVDNKSKEIEVVDTVCEDVVEVDMTPTSQRYKRENGRTGCTNENIHFIIRDNPVSETLAKSLPIHFELKLAVGESGSAEAVTVV